MVNKVQPQSGRLFELLVVLYRRLSFCFDCRSAARQYYDQPSNKQTKRSTQHTTQLTQQFCSMNEGNTKKKKRKNKERRRRNRLRVWREGGSPSQVDCSRALMPVPPSPAWATRDCFLTSRQTTRGGIVTHFLSWPKALGSFFGLLSFPDLLNDQSTLVPEANTRSRWLPPVFRFNTLLLGTQKQSVIAPVNDPRV